MFSPYQGLGLWLCPEINSSGKRWLIDLLYYHSPNRVCFLPTIIFQTMSKCTNNTIQKYFKVRQIYISLHSAKRTKRTRNFSSNVLTKFRCIQGYQVWFNSARANKGPGIYFTTVINLLTFSPTDSDGVKYKLMRGDTRKTPLEADVDFFPSQNVQWKSSSSSFL